MSREPHGPGRPAVFLDRDGTLIEDVGFLARVEQVQLYPWTIAAVQRLNQAGLPVVVTTNQSGVARGFLTEAGIDEVHRHLSAVLEPAAPELTRITIVRTIRKARSTVMCAAATVASRGRDSSIAPPAICISIPRDRSSLGTSGSMSDWRGRSARQACWYEPGMAVATRSLRDSRLTQWSTP